MSKHYSYAAIMTIDALVEGTQDIMIATKGVYVEISWFDSDGATIVSYLTIKEAFALQNTLLHATNMASDNLNKLKSS